MFSSADHLILSGKRGDRPTRLNGVGAKPMLFPKVLCADCNNSRSQPFDQAYDRFVDKVWSDPDYFRVRAHFNMGEIFPNDPTGGADLARYYVKNVACRIAEIGFAVPAPLVDFMDGALWIVGGTLVLYRDFSNFDQFRRAGTDGHYPFANRMHDPESPADGPLRAVCAEIQNGPVGAMLWWSKDGESRPMFCLRSHTFLRDRRELPHPELHEDEWARADLMKQTQDRQGIPSYP